MPKSNTTRYYKVVVCFERRPDGGLRAWSDGIPGLVLSHRNVDRLLDDVAPALETLLSEQFGGRVVAAPLDDLRAQLEDGGVIESRAMHLPTKREYVAHYA